MRISQRLYEGCTVESTTTLHLLTPLPPHLHLPHTFTSSHLYLHTFTFLTPSPPHTFTSTPSPSSHLHLPHTFTSSHLYLHTFTSSHLYLHTFTSSHLHLLTPLPPHTFTFLTPSPPHTFTSSHLHLLTDELPDLNDTCYDKVALLIGNKKYHQGQLMLNTPENDTQDLAGVLRSAGFKVVSLVNLTKMEMDQVLE